MRELASEEALEAEQALMDVESALQVLLLPQDPSDKSNVYLEIRAGTGGDEAAIFPATYSGCITVMQSRKGGLLRCYPSALASTVDTKN